MSRMVVVTLPEDQVNQLEFLAKEESNRIGKEVTMTDLAERAVRQQIKRMKQKDRKRNHRLNHTSQNLGRAILIW